ncbi:hypothetical protein [Azohydromonas caseinilytica]|uniref:Uncharacterized protein n=1 Tax=Azohydromonas caseinilytica TaxID=2728836 RepID=A0A848FCX5_9BURK|nr:hypothetical protein [Azohydromonas caseinilytica]NML16836.1 hypothetical protein [Azohydromonas caseinilytica]
MATYTIVKPGRLGLSAVRAELLNRGPDSFGQDLQEISAALKADGEEALAQARELLQAAQLLLREEQQRLVALAPGDLRAAALDRAATLTLRHVQALRQLSARAAIRPPRVQRGEALLHGRVTDELDRAAGPLTVTLADARGRPVPDIAPATVDATGYYALVVPAEVVARLGAEARLSLVLSHGEDKVTPKLEPVALAGGVRVVDVKLDPAALGKLRLRPAADTPARPRPPAQPPATPPRKPRGPAKE